MFSSKNQLLKRTPENGTDRENFLSLLVDEFLHSSSYGKWPLFLIVEIRNWIITLIWTSSTSSNWFWPFQHSMSLTITFLTVLIFSDAKCQVLANLANFAYDPINYGYIRDVGVLDIFLHVVKNETDEKLLRFAIAGICNLCLGKCNTQQTFFNYFWPFLKHIHIITNYFTLYVPNVKHQTCS